MSSDIEMIDPPPRSASMAPSATGRGYDSAATATPTPTHSHHFNNDGGSGSASGVEIEAELEQDEYDSGSEREDGDEEHDEDEVGEGDIEEEHDAGLGDHDRGEGAEHEGDEENSDTSSSEEDSEEDDEEGEGAEAEVDTSTGQVQPRLPSVAPSAPSSTPAPAQPRSPKRMSIELLVHPSPSPAGPSKSISPTTSAPPPPPSATSVTPAPSQKKPRSKRTPSPPPPLPAAPLQTIRLEIKLGGPTNYEVDISKLAKETGQRAPSPVRVLPVEILGEEGVSEGEGAGKGKKRKKKAATSEYYDISDPFIDDSELALDDRKWFAQTKQQGFYVSSGEVALLKDRSPKKPKSKKNPLIPTSASIAPPKPDPSLPTSLPLPGSISAPPNLNGFGGEEDEKAGQKRKRYVTVVEGGKKRKVVDVNSFHPELQAGIEELKKAIAAESWAQKGKFPPNIKPLLAKLAMDAIKLDEYDEHFFNLMPTLFPYNKFTMMKLIKRTVFQDHVNLLMERQDTLLAELTELVKEGFAKAEEEYEKAKIVWDKRQEKAKVENPSGSSDPVSTTPTRHTTEEMDVDNPPASTAGAGHQEKEHENKPPQKRYRLSDRMKTIVWQLVCLSNECCRLENEKNGLEGSVIQVSEQGGRKALYQKIVAAFPDGWMNSGQISRDVSVMKKKFEKEQMENET